MLMTQAAQLSLWLCLFWRETPNIIVDLQILRKNIQCTVSEVWTACPRQKKCMHSFCYVQYSMESCSSCHLHLPNGYGCSVCFGRVCWNLHHYERKNVKNAILPMTSHTYNGPISLKCPNIPERGIGTIALRALQKAPVSSWTSFGKEHTWRWQHNESEDPEITSGSGHWQI